MRLLTHSPEAIDSRRPLGRSVRQCSTNHWCCHGRKPANCSTSSPLFAVCETSSYATPTCITYYFHPSVSYRDCFCALSHFTYQESISQALFNLLVLAASSFFGRSSTKHSTQSYSHDAGGFCYHLCYRRSPWPGMLGYLFASITQKSDLC